MMDLFYSFHIVSNRAARGGRRAVKLLSGSFPRAGMSARILWLNFRFRFWFRMRVRVRLR